MNVGIDTGDVIHQKEFNVNIGHIIPKSMLNEDIYAALLTYYDPCLRVTSLIDLFQNNELNNGVIKTDSLPIAPQKTSEGRMYFFMHKELRDFVIDEYIRLKK